MDTAPGKSGVFGIIPLVREAWICYNYCTWSKYMWPSRGDRPNRLQRGCFFNMEEKALPKYYLVESSVLPEVFIKVTQVRELLETGEVKTVAEAVERVGISRSAFYKYKDSVMPFRDMKRGSIVTFHALLRDKKGVLSSLLAIFADTGANILTINQSIPSNGTALVTISATTENMPIGTDELITKARELEGVIRFDALAG